MSAQAEEDSVHPNALKNTGIQKQANNLSHIYLLVILVQMTYFKQAKSTQNPINNWFTNRQHKTLDFGISH
jgi:hypothetical protein